MISRYHLKVYKQGDLGIALYSTKVHPYSMYSSVYWTFCRYDANTNRSTAFANTTIQFVHWI